MFHIDQSSCEIFLRLPILCCTYSAIIVILDVLPSISVRCIISIFTVVCYHRPSICRHICHHDLMLTFQSFQHGIELEPTAAHAGPQPESSRSLTAYQRLRLSEGYITVTDAKSPHRTSEAEPSFGGMMIGPSETSYTMIGPSKSLKQLLETIGGYKPTPPSHLTTGSCRIFDRKNLMEGCV